MKYQMKQCILRKGTIEQTAWIPVKYAVIGKFVKLNEDNGWEIISTGMEIRSSDYVDDRSQDYKRTRKASDI